MNNCKLFWCAEIDCKSYTTGENCKKCSKYEKCEECILHDELPLLPLETPTDQKIVRKLIEE